MFLSTKFYPGRFAKGGLCCDLYLLGRFHLGMCYLRSFVRRVLPEEFCRDFIGWMSVFFLTRVGFSGGGWGLSFGVVGKFCPGGGGGGGAGRGGLSRGRVCPFIIWSCRGNFIME